MTTSTGFDYSNISGALTPQQAAQALASAEGDTGAQPDNGGAPATTPATDDKGPTGNDQGTKADQGGADNGGTTASTTTEEAVVLARDGKHTIPYTTLEKHRQGEQHWKAQAEAAQQQLSELQAQAQSRADAGQAPTKTDNMVAQAQAAIDAGADEGLFGDFSEEALKAGIQKLVTQQVQERVDHVLKPLQAKQQKDTASAHYDAIYGKHADADSIAESAEFEAWVNGHPSAVRDAYWTLFDATKGGTADQIVEVFDAFKAAITPKPTTTAATSTEAARAALASTQTAPPSSLSSIPGGRASGASDLDGTADMSGQEMLQATKNMSPAQLEAWLNKQI